MVEAGKIHAIEKFVTKKNPGDPCAVQFFTEKKNEDEKNDTQQQRNKKNKKINK